MDRRTFLKSSASALTLLALPGFAQANAQSRSWLTGFGKADGTFGAARIEDDFSVTEVLSSSLRLHDVLVHPTQTEICAPARRPGDLLWIVDKNREVYEVAAPEGRHYCGHGAYAPDGGTLFVAENDYDNERGVIGFYDANNGYQRQGDIFSGGIGPHQLKVHPDGKHLVMANGGILTHPDTGRAKLNLDTMQPNLSLIDMKTHKIVESVQLPADIHHLSLRHIDVTPLGAVVFGVQDQQRPLGTQPMVGIWTPGRAPRLFATPSGGWSIMNGYVGSIAVDQAGQTAAAAAPRGGVVVFWDIPTGEALGVYSAQDVCGVARTHRANGFLVTTGQGDMTQLRMTPKGLTVVKTASSKLQFDNHCCPNFAI